MRKVIWSPEAEGDLRQVWDDLATTATLERADDLVRAIAGSCDSLVLMPFRGRSRNELRPGLRSILKRPYVAFYRVAPDRIEIVRILHERRDLVAIFKEP